MIIDVEDNLIDGKERNSMIIEDEIENFLETNEGQNIKADIEILKSMGYDKKMINKVYILLRPENIERAIDYMTEFDGVYHHNFISSNNPKEKNLCFICKKTVQFHLNYIPQNLLDDEPNINFNNNNQDLLNIDNDLIEENNQNDNNAECEVCYEDIDEENKDKNKIPCGHLFCSNCWYNYLKTLILEAKVDNIKCMDHECQDHISDEFIMKSNNDNLVEKYIKFKKRSEIIKDKNKKLCPNPNCDSYLEKSKNKYVKCENGHEYCFECLKPPHGKKSCDEKIEKQFMKWTKGKRVKRCPRCKMYTEKNEGCNHMTCAACKYQWCWICEKQYNYGHYDFGSCAGQQFTKANNLSEIKPIIYEIPRNRNIYDDVNYCGLIQIFRDCCIPVKHPFEVGVDQKYYLMVAFWIFGVWMIFFYNVYTYLNHKTHLEKDTIMFFSVFTGVNMFIAFEATFSTLITPLMFICYYCFTNLFDKVLLFFNVGND